LGWEEEGAIVAARPHPASAMVSGGSEREGAIENGEKQEGTGFFNSA
jgi:hypothetical protein